MQQAYEQPEQQHRLHDEQFQQSWRKRMSRIEGKQVVTITTQQSQPNMI